MPAAGPGQALEHRTHRRGVGLRKALRHRRVVDGGCRGEQRCRAVKLARKIGDDAHVFLPDADFHRCFGVVVANHHRAADLQHPRSARAIAQHLDHRCGIEPGLHAEHERFGRRYVMNCDEQVRDEFHLGPGAERTKEIVRARKRLENRDAAAIRVACAACVDDEIFYLRLSACAAQWAIEQRDALLRQEPARAFLGRDRQRAGFAISLLHRDELPEIGVNDVLAV